MARIVSLDLSRQVNFPIRILVIGDTHAKKFDQLDSGLRDLLSSLEYDLLFHTGDIYTSDVLKALQRIRGCHAVRGNRDLLLWIKLPAILQLKLPGVTLCLFHGHGDFLSYLRVKWMAMRKDKAVFRQRFTYPEESRSANILITGHTHYPACEIENGQLILNPGAAVYNRNEFGYPHPTIALLTIETPSQGFVEFFQQIEWTWHEPCKLNYDIGLSDVRKAEL